MKKTSLLMLLGGKPEKEEDSSTDSLVAAKAILAALKANDATKLDEALRSHYALCE